MDGLNLDIDQTNSIINFQSRLDQIIDNSYLEIFDYEFDYSPNEFMRF